MDDEVDVAPVDAEVERRGADHGAELSRRHRRLDLPPLGRVERAVMERDGEALVVDPPELLEDQLRLAPRVDEEERHAVRCDPVVDVGDGVAGRMPGPGHPLLRVEDRDIRLCPTPDRDQVGESESPLRPCAVRQLSPAGRGRFAGAWPAKRVRGLGQGELLLLPHQPPP
jgi:hypothetical protein